MRIDQLFQKSFILVAVAMLVLTSGARSQSVYPGGLSEQDLGSGIYAGTDAGDCCWMGKVAQFRTSVPAGADALILRVFLPSYAVAQPQELHVRVGDSQPALQCCIGAGAHEIVVPFARAATARTLAVEVRALHTFQPKQLGLNEDTRDLSVIVRSIALEDRESGEVFEASPELWNSSTSHVPYLVVFTLAALILTLWRPFFGLAALIAADPFLFAYTYHGKLLTLPKLMLVAIAIGLIRHAPRILTMRNWHTFALLGGAQLVFLLTMLPGGAGFSNSEFVTAFEYLVTFAVGYLAYRLDPNEQAVRVMLSLTTLVVVTLAFLTSGSGGAETEALGNHIFNRLAGQLEGPNQLAGFLDVVLPALLAFVTLRRGMPVEYLALAAGFAAAWMTFSRAGIAALLIAFAVIVSLRCFPTRTKIVGLATGAAFAAGLAIAVGIFVGVLQGGIAALFGSTNVAALNGGLGTRVDLWHGAYALWRTSPLFGIGAGNYEIEIGRYFPGVRTHANSMFFQVLAEQGVLGFLAMLAVIALTVRAFARRLTSPLALAAAIATVGLTFHQLADSMWLFPKVGVMWWLLLSVAAADNDVAVENDRGEVGLRQTSTAPHRVVSDSAVQA